MIIHHGGVQVLILTELVPFDDLLELIEQRLLLFRTHLLNLRKAIYVQRSLLNQRSLPSLRSRLSLVEGLLVLLLRCIWLELPEAR